MDNKYIKLYKETVTSQFPKAVEIIKDILIENKARKYNWSLTINQIHQEFIKIQERNIIRSPELSHLLKAYKDGLTKYEPEYKFYSIPNELKTAFDSGISIKISFEEYVKQLATEFAFFKIENLVYNSRPYELMYKIGRFEGYENFQKFDFENIIQKSESSDLFLELHRIVYPKNYKEKPLIVKGSKKLPFEFQKKYKEVMKKDKIYREIEEEFFDSNNVTYKDYLNVFFNDPSSHNSIIELSCKTSLFALFLSELKPTIASRVSYTEIDKFKLFETSFSKSHLTRSNISNSKRKATISDKNRVELIIQKIKKYVK